MSEHWQPNNAVPFESMSSFPTPPPHDRGIEEAVLSVLLKEASSHVTIALAEGVTAESFYVPAYRSLFRRLCRMVDEGMEVDLVSLTADMLETGDLDDLGGPSALAGIFSKAPTSGYFRQHLTELLRRHALRIALNSAEKAKEAALEPGADPLSVSRIISDASLEVNATVTKRSTLKGSQKACGELYAIIKKRLDDNGESNMTTEIPEIDALANGPANGEFWVFCGLPSSGKSVLCYQSILPSILEGKHVLVFTLEMPAYDVIARLIACQGVDKSLIDSPQDVEKNSGQFSPKKRISKGQLNAIKTKAKKLAGSNLQIDDSSGMTIDHICATAEAYNDKSRVSAVVVDYIQLIEGDASSRESREQQVSRVSRRLKQLAKKLECPVISAAQLNDDGRLRESRAIGQDADVVMKITKDGIKVDKYRNGERGATLPLELNGKFQRFERTHQDSTSDGF